MNHSKNIQQYYQEFSSLFHELTDHSSFLNLGFLGQRQLLKPPRQMQEQLIRMVASAGGFKKGMRVLDVGCGLGGPARSIAEFCGCSVIGIDPISLRGESSFWESGHQANKPGVHFSMGDAMDMPFSEGCFDRVYCVESAFHYIDKSRFVQEAARVLRKNGKLVIADILHASRHRETGLSRLIKRAVSAENFYNQASYENDASARGMEMILKRDITNDVLRTFPSWRKAYLRKWKTLSKIYPFGTLFIIGVALWTLPLVVKMISFQYGILVFGFTDFIKRTMKENRT